MGSTLKHTQPTLVHVPIEKDIVYTPEWLSKAIVDHFCPVLPCLDPCRGGGAFYKYMPSGSDWCEIEDGRDFYQFTGLTQWCVGNPPYSELLGWIRHSFTVAENVVYLVPLHRIMASYQFLQDLDRWGGIAEILLVGTGTTAGFPFGHALAAVHFKKNYKGGTVWSHLVYE